MSHRQDLPQRALGDSCAPADYEYPLDTPLKAAKRLAFDNPTQANLDALIEAAKEEARQ